MRGLHDYLHFPDGEAEVKGADKLSRVGGQFLSVPHRPTAHMLHPVLLVPLHVVYKIRLARLCSLRMPVRFMGGEHIWNTGQIDDTQ